MTTAMPSELPLPHASPTLPIPLSAASLSRSSRFDVIRVSACLAVILLHLSATIVMDQEFVGSVGWYASVILDAGTRWCVVVFVMLSGALLLSPEKHASPREFWARRLSRLLPALIAWSTIYLAWRAYFWKQPLTLGLIAHDLLVGRPYIHLYFLFLITGLYLVTPLLAAIVKSLNSAQLRQAILIIAILAMAANLFDFLASSAFTMFVPYLAYYLAGWYCTHVLDDHPRPYGNVIGGTIVIMTLLSILLVSANGLGNRWSFYFFEDFSPTGIVLAIAVFLFILHGPISPRVEAVAQKLAPSTLGVYLAHPLVVEILRHGYHTKFPIMFQPHYYIPLTFLATCILTFGLVALMQRVPGLQRIV